MEGTLRSPPPRYSSWPLPPYRYDPGRHPHPRRHPAGHSHGRPEPAPPRPDPGRWAESPWYRYGVDLYNEGYFWECHEVFEGLWRAAGDDRRQADFFRALVQVAAAHLKRRLGHEAGARRLARRGVARLRGLPPRLLGVDVAPFARAVESHFEAGGPGPVPLRLANPGAREEPWPKSR